MQIRSATTNDAGGMSKVLHDLLLAGKRKTAGGPDWVRTRYICDPDRICCSVAIDDDGSVLGFQSLKHAREGNPYGTPVGWGIIGTHIRPSAARRGIGMGLFAVSRKAALHAGLQQIEACIGADNEAGLAYYEAMGFRSHDRQVEGAICKSFAVSSS